MKIKFPRHSVNHNLYLPFIAFMAFVTIEGCGTSTKASKTPETKSIPKKVPLDSIPRPARSDDSLKMNKQ